MDIKSKIIALANENPMLFAKGTLEADIDKIEEFSGFRLPEIFRWFIVNFGSGEPGSFTLYGVGIPDIWGGGELTIIDVTTEFIQNGWTAAEKGLVVAIDGRGNPVVLLSDGSIIIEDHDVSDVRVIAKNYEELLVNALDDEWNII